MTPNETTVEWAADVALTWGTCMGCGSRKRDCEDAIANDPSVIKCCPDCQHVTALAAIPEPATVPSVEHDVDCTSSSDEDGTIIYQCLHCGEAHDWGAIQDHVRAEHRPEPATVGGVTREQVAAIVYGVGWSGPYDRYSYAPNSLIGMAYARADAILALVQPDECNTPNRMNATPAPSTVGTVEEHEAWAEDLRDWIRSHASNDGEIYVMVERLNQMLTPATTRDVGAEEAWQVEAAVTDLSIESLARAWMEYLGYSAEQVAEAAQWQAPREGDEPEDYDGPPQIVRDLDLACEYAREMVDPRVDALLAAAGLTLDRAASAKGDGK